MLRDTLPPQSDNAALRFEEGVRDVLVVAGLQEIVSYRLVACDHEAGIRADASAAPLPYVVLANPISPERAAMRRSLLTGLLDALQANLRHHGRVALFEIGSVYEPRPGGLPDEPRRLAIAMAGAEGGVSWRSSPPRDLDFYDAKGAVETLLERIGAAGDWTRAAHPSLHPARTAEIRVGGASIGHVGELHPVVRARWGLGETAVAVADLDLDALERVASDARTFAPFSPYPAVQQDLAVVVAEGVPAADVAAVIRRAGGGLLSGLSLFDVYRGGQVGADRKSLAWSLTFQAPDRTLDGKAVDAVRERIVRALQAELDAELR